MTSRSSPSTTPYSVDIRGPTTSSSAFLWLHQAQLCAGPATGRWGSGTAGAPVSTRTQRGHPAIPRDFSHAGGSPWGQSDWCHPQQGHPGAPVAPPQALPVSAALQTGSSSALTRTRLPKDHRDVLSPVRQAGVGGPHKCPEPLRTLYFTGAARRQPSGSPWWSPQEKQTCSRCESDSTGTDSREDRPGEEEGLSSESLIPTAG